MALPKINTYQQALLQKNGATPNLYDGWSQADFDSLYPPAPNGTKAAPYYDPTGAEITNALQPPASLSLDRGYQPSQQEQPIPQAAPFTVPRIASGVEEYQDARLKFLEGWAQDPKGAHDLVREQLARARAKEIENQPLSVGGRVMKDTPLIDTYPEIEAETDNQMRELQQMRTGVRPKTGLIGLAAALSPSVIATSEEARKQNHLKFQATLIAAEQLEAEYLLEIKNFDAAMQTAMPSQREQFQVARERVVERLAEIRSEKKMSYATQNDLEIRRDKILRGEVGTNTYSGVLKGQSSHQGRSERLSLAGAKLAESALVSRGPGGQLVESPAMYAGRLLSAPVSGLVGVAEAGAKSAFDGPGDNVSFTDEIRKTVPARIEGGLGIMGGGADFGGAIARSLGAEEGSDGETAGRYIGGGVGLVFDFLLPIAPGVGALTKGAEGAVVAARLAGTLDNASVAGRGLAAGRGFALGGLEGLVDDFAIGTAFRLTGRDAPLRFSASSDALRTFVNKPENIQIAKNLVANIEEGAPLTDESRKLIERLGFKEDNFANNKASIDRAIRTEESFRNFKKELAIKRAAPDAIEKLRKQKAAYEKLIAETIGKLNELKATNKAAGEKLVNFVNNNLEELNKIAGSVLTAKENSALSLPAFKNLTRNYDQQIKALQRQAFHVKQKIDYRIYDSQALPHLTAPANVKEKALLAYLGAEALNKADQLGDYLRISRGSFIPVGENAAFRSKLKKSFVYDLRKDIAAGKIEIKNGRILLDEAQLKQLYELTGQEISPENLASFVSTGLPLEKFNVLVEKNIDAIAQTMPGYKSVNDIARELKSKSLESVYKGTKYAQKMLTPKEVAGGTIERELKAAANVIRRIAPDSPLSADFVELVGKQFASMNEDFKTIVRQNKAMGMNPQEAWAKAVIDNYTRSHGFLEKSGEAWAALGSLDNDALIMNRLFAVDYIAQAFGGYESIAKVLQTTGGSKVLSALPVQPAEVRQLAYLIVANNEDMLGRFVDLVDAGKKLNEYGKYMEAINELHKFHSRLAGKSIADIFEEIHPGFSKLDWAGKQAAVDQMAKKAQELFGDFFVESPIRPITRAFPDQENALMDIFRQASGHKMLYQPDNILELLSAQYLVKRQSGILVESIARMAEQMSDIYISPMWIKNQAEKLDNVVRAVAKDRSLLNSPDVASIARGLKYLQENIFMNVDDVARRESNIKDLLGKLISDAIAEENQVARPLVDKLGEPLIQILRREMQIPEFIENLKPSLQFLEPAGSLSRYDQALQFSLRTNPYLYEAGPYQILETMGAAIDLKKAKAQLEAAGGIKHLTETMEELAEKQQSKPIVNRLLNRLGNVATLKTYDSVASFMKSGLLSGIGIPNIKFLMVNYLTGPSIVYSTLGARFGFSALKSQLFLEPAVNDTLRFLNGRIAPAPDADLLGIAVNAGTEKYLFTTPSGKVYTNRMLAELISENGITRSQISAELTNNVVKDVVAWSAAKSKNGTIQEKNLIRDVLQRDWAAVKSGKQMNIWAELANEMDVRYRTAVLIDALKEGRTEQEAIKLATEALFDYGSLTNFEREAVSRVFWFWTFYRNNLLTYMKNVSSLDKVNRIKNLYLATKYLDAGDKETNVSTKEYTQSRAFLWLVENPEWKQRYAVYGPDIPLLSATAELLDYLSYFPILTDETMTKREKIDEAITRPIQGVYEMSNPIIQLPLTMGFGINPRDSDRELTGYLDPRLTWYMQRNPRMWNLFVKMYNLEMVPVAEQWPGAGTYQGAQWRIKPGDQESVNLWYATQQALMLVGVQRMFRDYAPVLSEVFPGSLEGEVRPVQLQEGFWQSMGVQMPIEEPTLEERAILNRRILQYQFKDKSVKERTKY